MVLVYVWVLLCCLAIAYGQNTGTETTETHPMLTTVTTQQCFSAGACTNLATSVVLDSNLRPLHSVSSTTACYTCNSWNTQLCPDPVTCAENCALEGVDYAGTYGITPNGTALKLDFVAGCNVGSRVFLLGNTNTYKVFSLLNQELTFTVDASHLGCGVSGALYLTSMDADGGRSRFPGNKAGAAYGTGHCDAQCGRDVKFINGMANVVDWAPSTDDPHSGTGSFGSCCSEIDLWEGNMNAATYIAHACSVVGQTECSGAECGDTGVCDKDGCDFNSWRLGNTIFLGPGKTVDTTVPFTVVTQFLTDTNTAAGTLSEIRRIYVQHGRVIQNTNTNIPGLPTAHSITTGFCNAQKAVFGDPNNFAALGGLAGVGAALGRGMVLAMSIRDDYATGMLPLDGNYPADGIALGDSRGPCSAVSGNPETVEATQAEDYVLFSDIKSGPINSTFSATT